MIIRHPAAILALFLLLVAMNDRLNTGNLQHVNRPVDSANQKDACKKDRATIRTTLDQLSLGDYNQIVQARKSLLNIVHQSDECRQLVVRSLMDDMDKPNLDFERQPSNYYVWREGAQLLGELKAIEALDLLISHLDLTNGFHSSSMVSQPAILGVRQMGEAAIPKLAIALQQSPRAGLRMAAAYCLTEIGGTPSMNALEQAQEGERNLCVANFIKTSLSTFTYKSKNGTAFDIQTPQATADARRNWLTAFECVE